MLFSRLKYNAFVYAISAGGTICFEHPSIISYGAEVWPEEGLPFGTKTTYSHLQRIRQNRFLNSLHGYRVVNEELYHLSRKVIATDELDDRICAIHYTDGHPGALKTWQNVSQS